MNRPNNNWTGQHSRTGADGENDKLRRAIQTIRFLNRTTAQNRPLSSPRTLPRGVQHISTPHTLVRSYHLSVCTHKDVMLKGGRAPRSGAPRPLSNYSSTPARLTNETKMDGEYLKINSFFSLFAHKRRNWTSNIFSFSFSIPSAHPTSKNS